MRQVAVIGLGKFGSTVAKDLTDRGAQVIAIDTDQEAVEELKDLVAYAVSLDSTDEKALRSIGIDKVDVAVVCIGEDIEANLLTTLLLKKIGIGQIWARAISPLQQEILKILEVDSIINLEAEMGKIVASSIAAESVARHIPLAPGHSIAEVPVPGSFIGKTLRQIAPRERYHVNVVAFKRKVPKINDLGEKTFEEVIEDVPSPDEKLEEGEILLVVGGDKDIQNFATQ